MLFWVDVLGRSKRKVGPLSWCAHVLAGEKNIFICITIRDKFSQLNIKWTCTTKTHVFSLEGRIFIRGPAFQEWKEFTKREYTSYFIFRGIVLCSVTKSCPTLCYPMNWNMGDFPVLYYLLEFSQTHAHFVGDAIQPSYPISPPSPPPLNVSQHQGLFKWVSSSHEVAKVLELQFQHQSFKWIFRTDFL